MIRSAPTAPTAHGRRRLLLAVGAVAVALTLNLGLWLVDPGLALVQRAWSLGPDVVRAEVVVRNSSGVHAYRIDRGLVVRVGTQALVLRERDGLRVAVRVGPGTRIFVDGSAAEIGSVPRGARVEAVRLGDAPAIRVTAVTRK
jgi:hypothetical protein